MRGSRACVLLDAQNLADRSLIFVDSGVSRSRAGYPQRVRDKSVFAQIPVFNDLNLNCYKRYF